MNIQSLTATQLRKAADLKEQIENLHKQLTALLGGGSGISASFKSAKPAPKKKRTMSAAARAKISALAKKRWAKVKTAKPAVKVAKPVKKARKKMSAAAKAKISALMKARWAKAKATGKKSL
jgi:hypothetical protein